MITDDSLEEEENVNRLYHSVVIFTCCICHLVQRFELPTSAALHDKKFPSHCCFCRLQVFLKEWNMEQLNCWTLH